MNRAPTEQSHITRRATLPRHVMKSILLLEHIIRDYTSTFNIIITRLHLLHKCIHHLPDAHPITLTPYRDPSTSVICEFYHDEGLNVHSVSSAIFITRDTGARFRYAAYACVRACVRRGACMRAQVSEYARVHVHNGGV